MKIRTDAEADVNITSLIDCLMQCIIFFMVIMSAQYIFGVAIKFAPPGAPAKQEAKKEKQEKNIVVYVQSDLIEKNHALIRDGVVKLNGEDIALGVSSDPAKRDQEREAGYKYLTWKMKEYLKQGYKKDVLLIQGDMKTYHGKIMKIVDIGKGLNIESFALIPPTK
ncbi:MAG: biopolymer transporter ExbD [Chitinivibrionales bacterium]|nr:biopolymer transporter ExbD [Chitinivibrionales bacterium]